MTARKRLTVRMPDELSEELYKKSQRLGISKNALILKMLWDEIQNKKTEEE